MKENLDQKKNNNLELGLLRRLKDHTGNDKKIHKYSLRNCTL